MRSEESNGTDASRTGGRAAVAVCESVSREYSRGGRLRGGLGGPAVRALDGVSLSVRAGETVGIAGPSGSGKTTLLHLLAALETPTSGTVRLAGTDTAAVSERERAQLRLEHVGIVFQRFHLLPALSARANVALPLVELGLGKADRRERAENLLDRVGLGDRVTHRPGELSGGERQRVAMARALATDPDLVVADEPTGELDTTTSERVLDLLGSLDDETAVVIASHDEQALDRADRRLNLRDGRIAEGS